VGVIDGRTYIRSTGGENPGPRQIVQSIPKKVLSDRLGASQKRSQVKGFRLSEIGGGREITGT